MDLWGAWEDAQQKSSQYFLVEFVCRRCGHSGTSTEQMQIALETADRVFSKWGLEMRFKKTKVMAVDCEVVPSHFYLKHGSIETISCFKYLGSYLAKDGGIGLESMHRIKAAASFLKLEAFWKNPYVQEAVKYNM